MCPRAAPASPLQFLASQTFPPGLAILGRRCCVEIVRLLYAGAKRFNRIKEAVPGLSSKTLSSCLRDLERLGVVGRAPVDSRNDWESRFSQYQLTAAGRELHEVLERARTWERRWARGEN